MIGGPEVSDAPGSLPAEEHPGEGEPPRPAGGVADLDIPEEYRYLPDVPRGLSGVAADVAAVLSALARTSRSFQFYAPNNRALRLFMDDLDSQLQRFLGQHGALHLEVESTRFLWEGSVVHEDEDRERSLPFKLFRDGVRGLSVIPGVTQEEMARLLAILSVRLIGVHRHDEDLVTQLWRAELEHVRHDVVEGFTHEIYGSKSAGHADGGEADAGAAVPRIMARLRSGVMDRSGGPGGGGGTLSQPAEVSPEPGMVRDPGAFYQVMDGASGGAGVGAGGGVDPSVFAHAKYPGRPHYDIPAPSGVIEISSAPVTDDDRARFRAELEREEHDGLIHLIDAMLTLAVAHPDALPKDDVALAAAGARHSMVREERLADLVDYYSYLNRIAEGGVYAEVSASIAEIALPTFAEPIAVRDVATLGARSGQGALVARYFEMMGEGASAEAMLPLLDFQMPQAVLDAVLATMSARPGVDATWFAARLVDAGDLRARALMQGLLALGSPEAISEIEQQARHPHPARRFLAVDLLSRARGSAEALRTLVRALGDPAAAVRTRAGDILWQREEPEAFELLRGWLEGEGGQQVPAEELPRALALAARLGRDRSIPLLRAVVKVPKGWKLANAVEEARSRAAADALATIGTEAAESELRSLKDSGTREWRQHVLRCLLRAHRLRTGGAA